MEMPVCLNFMNNRNNTVPTGLCLPRYNTSYQNYVPMALGGQRRGTRRKRSGMNIEKKNINKP